MAKDIDGGGDGIGVVWKQEPVFVSVTINFFTVFQP